MWRPRAATSNASPGSPCRPSPRSTPSPAWDARWRRVPPPIAQGLVYPAVDLEELRFPSHQTVGSGFGLDRPAIEWFRSQYVPSLDDRRSPRVSPLLAADLSGLAPAL